MSNEKILYEEIAGTVLYNYHNYKMQEFLTESSTADNCILVTPLKVPDEMNSTVLFPHHSDEQTKAILVSLLNDGYLFTDKDVARTVSNHQGRLKRAKSKLLTEVLTKPNNVFARQDVIIDIGVALSYQVDIYKTIFENELLGDGLLDKLKFLGLHIDNKKLYDKCLSLNNYYNAAKHRSKKNIPYIDKLQTPEGRDITTDYFEAARLIFLWFYEKYTGKIPNWDELKPIDYSKYNSEYRFQLGTLR